MINNFFLYILQKRFTVLKFMHDWFAKSLDLIIDAENTFLFTYALRCLLLQEVKN